MQVLRTTIQLLSWIQLKGQKNTQILCLNLTEIFLAHCLYNKTIPTQLLGYVHTVHIVNGEEKKKLDEEAAAAEEEWQQLAILVPANQRVFSGFSVQDQPKVIMLFSGPFGQ